MNSPPRRSSRITWPTSRIDRSGKERRVRGHSQSSATSRKTDSFWICSSSSFWTIRSPAFSGSTFSPRWRVLKLRSVKVLFGKVQKKTRGMLPFLCCLEMSIAALRACKKGLFLGSYVLKAAIKNSVGLTGAPPANKANPRAACVIFPSQYPPANNKSVWVLVNCLKKWQ